MLNSMKLPEVPGILGSGQLALMLSEAADTLGIQALVFSESLQNQNAVKSFLNSVDFTTFESDFLDYDLLKEFSRNKFRPDLRCLEVLRDKVEQKKVLSDLNIKVSPWRIIYDEISIQLVESLKKELSGDLVFKWARGGYDGNGVFIFKDDLVGLKDFVDRGRKRGFQIFAERKVPYKSELALVSSRSLSGEFVSYPLVLTEQDNGICKNVFGPAIRLGVSSEVADKAIHWAKIFSDRLNLTGTFALEFFWDGQELITNEIAPRVHNSGHFSLGASKTSQFENHWRAIFDLSLGSTESANIFGMRNLLGTERALLKQPPNLDFGPRSLFKWYEKNESRLRRKMGHITMWSDDNDINALKLRLESAENDWRKSFFE